MKKKVLSMILALSLAAIPVCAYAETATDDAAAADAAAGEDIDMSALLGMLGGAGEGEEGGQLDMGALLSQLGIGEAQPVNFVEAESIDQFYGSWSFSKAIYGGYEMSAEALQTLGMDLALDATVLEDSIEFTALDETKAVDMTESEFADGVLNVTLDGEKAVLAITEEGELCLSFTVGEGEEASEIMVIMAPAGAKGDADAEAQAAAEAEAEAEAEAATEEAAE